MAAWHLKGGLGYSHLACWLLAHFASLCLAAVERAGTTTRLPSFGEDRIFNGTDARYIVSVEAAGARCAIAADFDEDGYMDLVVASSNDNTVAWYRRLEDGSYSTKNMITRASNGARIVAVGDIDQDGLVDVVSASYYDHTVRWFQNLGGSFGSAHVITTSAFGAQGVTLADLDNDGDLDVLSASSGDHTIAWYENLGDEGRFCEVRKIVDTASIGVRTVISADFNHDGLPDLAAASKDDNTIAWYRNLGGTRFEKIVIDSAARGAYSLVATDVDEDGNIDLVTAANMEGVTETSGEGGKVSFYRNIFADGAVDFSKVAVTAEDDLDYFVLSVWAGDLDGDGDVDIASASFGLTHSGGVSWYENVDGTGNQWERHKIYDPETFNTGHYIVGADMDGDGDTDLVAVTHSDNKVQILYASTVCDDSSDSPRAECCSADSVWNGSHCSQCAPGTFQQDNSCTPCPRECPFAGLSSLPPACWSSPPSCHDVNASYQQCDCDQESYFDRQTSVCTACPAGFLFPRTRNRTVVDFTLEEVTSSDGTRSIQSDLSWEAFNASQECVAPSCQAGSYFASQAGECTECLAGFFSTGGGVTTCTTCPSGHSCVAGSSSPTPCVPGYYAAEGSQACLPSDAGWIVPTSRMSAQVACPAGYFSAETASAECLPCAVGTYNSQEAQSACESCGLGKQFPERWTSMRLLRNGDVLQWVLAEAALSVDSCGCQPGARLEGAICVLCGEGLICNGMNDTRVQTGYFSDLQVSVFDCSNDVVCPGGVPGDSCREGHTGIQCAECKSGLTHDLSKLCQPCKDGDRTVAWICLGLLSGILVSLYIMSSRYRRVADGYMVLLAGLVATQAISVAQQLNIAGGLSLRITNAALRTVLGLLDVITFDISLFRIGCIASYSVSQKYLATVLLVIGCLAVAVLIHFVARLFCGVQGNRNCIALIGTICTVVYITVLSRCLAPYQCLEHPNGLSTLRLYPSVICWQSVEGEHHDLVLIGTISLVMPLGFLAVVIHAVLIMPQRMRKGDTVFLDAHGFLFSRFRPQTYWFIVVVMVRNSFLALAQVIPNTFGQITWLLSVQLLALMATLAHQPWRLEVANRLDIIFTIAMILTIHMASYYAHGVDSDTPGVMLLVVIVGVLVLIPCAAFYGLGMQVMRKFRKPYQYFLSHHKAKAGTFARLLKIFMQNNSKVQRKVFLDVDNLDDLDKLFEHIRDETQNLLIIGTNGVFLRPWCLGEMVTAYIHNIPSLCLICKGWEVPDADCIANINHLVDLTCLTENGMSAELIESTLWSIQSLPTITNPEWLNIASMERLVNQVVCAKMERMRSRSTRSNRSASEGSSSSSAAKNAAESPEFRGSNPTPELQNFSKGASVPQQGPSVQKAASNKSGLWGRISSGPMKMSASSRMGTSSNLGSSQTDTVKVLIACDFYSLEAVSGAMILQQFMLPYMFVKDWGFVSLLQPNQHVPASVQQVLFFCTANCLECFPLMSTVEAMTSSPTAPEIIPIIGDDTFEFPTNRKPSKDNIGKYSFDETHLSREVVSQMPPPETEYDVVLYRSNRSQDVNDDTDSSGIGQTSRGIMDEKTRRSLNVLIFKEIALPFYAKNNHLSSLKAELEMILQRMSKRREQRTDTKVIVSGAPGKQTSITKVADECQSQVTGASGVIDTSPSKTLANDDVGSEDGDSDSEMSPVLNWELVDV